MRKSWFYGRLAAMATGAAGLLSMAGCPPVAVIGFTIAAQTFLFVLGQTGIIEALANSDQPARKAGVVSLAFDDTPTDQPVSGQLNLDVGTTRALPLDGSAKALRGQSITGQASVTIYIGSGDSSSPCTDGERVGAFELSFNNGVVTAARSSLSLPSRALSHCITGTFSICIEVTTTVDVRIKLGQMSVTFGPAEGDAPGDDGDDGSDGDDVGDDDGDDGTDGQDDGDDMSDGGDDDGADDGDDDGADDGDDDGADDGDDDMTGDDDDGADDDGAGDGGFVPATISHRGYERLIAGPDVDPAFGYVYSNDYTVAPLVFDERNDSIALSGDATKVWFRLRAPFPNESRPPTLLWSINIDGTGAAASALPGGDDLFGGLHLRTTEDGETCVANNHRQGRFYAAKPGQAAATFLDYAADALDIRNGFDIDDDGVRVAMIDWQRARLLTVDRSIAPAAWVPLVQQADMPLQGVLPRNVPFEEFDLAGDAARFIFRANYSNSMLTPQTQDVIYVGTGFAGPGLGVVDQRPFDDTLFDLNISDDGQTIAYCQDSPGVNSPNECWVETVDGATRTQVGDRRTTVGELTLANGAARVYYRTDRCCDGGNAILEDVGGGKVPAGTQVFAGAAAPGWTKVSLSDDGNTLVTAAPRGLYVLHDGVNPSGGAMPSIDSVSYRFNDDCTLTLRVKVTAPRGVERIFVNPYNDGVDPTEFVPGAENPFFAIRGGGGVNMSTRFVEVEGAPGAWEYTFALTNDSAACVQDMLTTDFRLRIILVDANRSVAVYQDFSPLE